MYRSLIRPAVKFVALAWPRTSITSLTWHTVDWDFITVGALPREGGNLRARNPYQLCITGPTRRVPHAAFVKPQNSAPPATFCEPLQPKAHYENFGRLAHSNRPGTPQLAEREKHTKTPVAALSIPAKRSVRRTSNRSSPEPSTPACAITSLCHAPNQPPKQQHAKTGHSPASADEAGRERLRDDRPCLELCRVPDTIA